MTQTEDWPAELTHLIGKQVQRYRKQAGLTAEQLAAAVTAAGLPFTRAQVTNLEARRRDSVTLGELLILGHVLAVPPAALMFPVGEATTVAVSPGNVREPWDALRWFSGEVPSPGLSGARLQIWRTASEALHLHRRHQELITELRASSRRKHEALVTRFRPVATDADRSAAERLEDAEFRASQQLEGRLQDLRRQIQKLGLEPPTLPADWAHLDRGPAEI